MFCPQCGIKVDDGANFCKNCAYPVGTIQMPANRPPVSPPPTPAPPAQNPRPAPPAYTPLAPTPRPAPPAPTPRPAPASKPASASVSKQKVPQDDVLMGTIGAVLGAALVGVLMALLAKWGFISTVLGAGVAFACMTGYELLGGETSGTAVVVTIALCLATPYLADRAAWAMVIREAYGEIGLWEAFKMVPELVGTMIDTTVYWKDLIILYVLTAAGAIGILKDEF